MLSTSEEEQQRLAFELAYAKHAVAHAGLSGSPQEIAMQVKQQRQYRRYHTEELTQLWEGYQLAPYAMPPRVYMADMDRDGLERCIRAANERLELLNNAERVEVWNIVLDGMRRYTATTALDAMSWIARMAAAYEAAPPPVGDGPLELGDRLPLHVEYRRVYPDELADLLSGNEKPEACVKF